MGIHRGGFGPVPHQMRIMRIGRRDAFWISRKELIGKIVKPDSSLYGSFVPFLPRLDGSNTWKGRCLVKTGNKWKRLSFYEVEVKLVPFSSES